MYFSILIIHTISMFLFGKAVTRRWFDGYPLLFTFVGAFLVGNLIGIPMTYVLSCLFIKTGEPLLWGSIVAAVFMLGIGSINRSTDTRVIRYCDLAMVACALVFSTWLMIKTFHGDHTGQLFVGSNNIFDFGMSLGLMRSIAWGGNIPIMSPFFAGLPILYHFFFIFWAAVWEYLGVPTVWAVNIPSIFSFTVLLLMIYYFPQIIARQKPFVGWLAVLLTITNSSLTFWQIVGKKDIWHLPTYPFAGPFDGSTISIFVTLNNYVNQRHLAFSIATALLLFILAFKKKSAFIVGLLTGLLIGWNMVIFVFTIAIISLSYISNRLIKQFFIFLIFATGVGSLFLLPIAGFLMRVPLFLGKLSSSMTRVTDWNIIDYLWQNLGFLPLVAGAGLLILTKKYRKAFLPFVVGFFLLCLLATVDGRGFEQKTYSFFIIGLNILAAIGIGWFWRGKKIITKMAVVCVIFILTISGIVDLIPIKNEFAFPLVNKDMIPLMSWIRQETPKNAVFISYADMIDPVVLAGRKNYFGFFGNIGWYDRSVVVRKVYEGMSAKEYGISYILVPKWEISDFPYEITLVSLPVAYEDARFAVFRVE